MTNPFTDLSPDTDIPAWLSWLIKLALLLVPAALAIFQPNGAFNSASAQAIVLGVGVTLAVLVHVVELIAKNGLTKAGLEKTASQEVAWVKENQPDLKLAYDQLQEALKTIPGVPADLEALKGVVGGLTDRFNAIPAVDMAPIEVFVKAEIVKAFGKVAAS